MFQYLPITLEDEAVIRDEEFARAQASKFAPLVGREDRDGDGTADEEQDLQDVLENQERRENEADLEAEEQERREIAERRRTGTGTPRAISSEKQAPRNIQQQRPPANPTWKTDRWRQATPQKRDVEAQHTTVGDVLFSGFADELEDLTSEERDTLVRYAFQHSALRTKRPVVWIPRDKLGVSDDEIKRAQRMSTVADTTYIWMSNEGTALDGKGRVVFRRSPPDFSNASLIAL